MAVAVDLWCGYLQLSGSQDQTAESNVIFDKYLEKEKKKTRKMYNPGSVYVYAHVHVYVVSNVTFGRSTS